MATPEFMQGTIDVPALGTVPKGAVIVIGGGAAVFVAYKWWQHSSSVGEEEIAPEDPAFGEGEVLPEVENAYPSDNSFGIGGGETSPDDYGFTGTKNTQWTQYVTTRLTQSDRWSYTDIVEALGAYINRKPLTNLQISIVQAAIAEAGYPPEGSYTIISGGSGENAETEIKVAPSGVKVTPKSSTVLTVSWNEVAGADEYRVYRKGVAQNVGSSRDTVADIGGLKPDTLYTFTVAALNSAGKAGPRSGEAKGTTKDAALKAPTGLKARTEGHTVVHLTWKAVAGADGYRVYHDASAHNVAASNDTSARISSLQRNRTYKFHVRAIAGNTTGPASSRVTVRTK